MTKIVLKGAILGGLAAFLWGAFSWMALPWHNMTISAVPRETELSTAIKNTVEEDGLYIIPWSTEKGSEEAVRKKMAEGPFAFMAIKPGGTGTAMSKPMFISILVNMFVAGLLTCLLLQSNISGFIKRMGFVQMAALSGAIIVLFNHWNWWGFGTSYTLVYLADIGITYGIVGSVLAKIIPKEGKAN